MIRRLVIVAGLATAVLAQEHKNPFLTGQAWHDQWTKDMRTGYVLGFGDGYAISSRNAVVSKPLDVQSREAVRRIICMDRMTLGQTVAVVDKYVTDHPERWHEYIGDLFQDAITKACTAQDSRLKGQAGDGPR